MYVRFGRGVKGLCSECLMSMGRWSEGSSWRVFHEQRREMSGEARETSGEVC